MAVKLRLRREGTVKRPHYRIVAADSRSPRDGRFIETIGNYHPLDQPSTINVDNERALHWLRNGALRLQIIDDGRGCDLAALTPGGGSGLGGMRERLRLYGGRLELRTAPGQGMCVSAVVPPAAHP